MLKRIDDDHLIVKTSSAPRYVVGCRTKLDKNELKSGYGHSDHQEPYAERNRSECLQYDQ
jgi:ATP-dependent 26S proteasome regulatory subunit